LKNFRVSGGTPAVRVRHASGDEDRDYYLGVLHITRLPKDTDGRASIGGSLAVAVARALSEGDGK